MSMQRQSRSGPRIIIIIFSSVVLHIFVLQTALFLSKEYNEFLSLATFEWKSKTSLPGNKSSIENKNGTNKHHQDIFSASYDNNIPDRQNKTAFITFSYMGNITKFNRIILSAVKTWIPKDEVYYVVLNHQWNETFANWKHDMMQKNETMVNWIQPIFVDCPESQSGESPCCKQEKGLIEFYDKYFYDRKYDWVYFADDDMFINTKLLFEYMEALPYGLTSEHARLMENGPFLLLSEGYRPRPLGYGKVARTKYECENTDASFRYPWGQPVMYNRQAMNKIITGLRLGGLVKQCLEYDVNHDVGNAIFHWMYSLPYASFPRITNLKLIESLDLVKGQLKQKMKLKYFRDDTVGIHGIDIEEYFSQERFWNLRHNDSIRVFLKDKLPPEVYFGFGNVSGFYSTDTFSMYGSPDEWKEEWYSMNTSDCIKKR